MRSHKRIKVKHSQIYGSTIIGYNPLFWQHCESEDKDTISNLSTDDQLHILPFTCNRMHQFKETPYDFFFSRYYCPICISGNDIGALRCDSELEKYYADPRYKLDEISEQSKIEFLFRCPFCQAEFNRTMKEMIRNHRKCPLCQQEDITLRTDIEAKGFNYLDFR